MKDCKRQELTSDLKFETSLRRLCFVTEADLDMKGFGGITTDKQLLSCLNEFGEVDILYFQRKRYRSTILALFVLLFQIHRSFSKRYEIYFSRGLVTTSFLVVFNRLTGGKAKIVHRGLSVPLASKEVKFLKYNKLESFFRFCLFSFLERVVLPQVSAVSIAAAGYGDDLFRIGVKRRSVYVIPFFVDDAFFEEATKRNPNATFTFGYAGGFHLYHDVLPMIEAFALFSRDKTGVRLILVGDGLSRRQIEQEVQKMQLTHNIKFLGKLPHTSMPKILSQMDCFVLLTQAFGLPIGLLEAAAAGRPVITVRKRGDLPFNRIFRHEKEILAVDTLEPEKIARAFQRIYRDHTLRATLSKAVGKVAKQNFSKEATLSQLDALLGEIL